MIDTTYTYLSLWVLLPHFPHILLELHEYLKFGYLMLNLGAPWVAVGKHNTSSVVAYGLSLHCFDFIRVNQLQKSRLCLILWGLERLLEHVALDTCLTRACGWALLMQLNTVDYIWEPFHSWQWLITEGSIPDMVIVVINSQLNIGTGLQDVGEGSQPPWFVYSHKGFSTGRPGCGCTEKKLTIDERCIIDKYWP